MSKIKHFLRGALILFGGTVMLSSCKKFEDGGLVSKADKRITEKWKFEKYYRNGVDETSKVDITNWVDEFTADSKLNRSYVDNQGELKTEDGTWELVDGDQEIKVDGIGSVELYDDISTVSSSRFIILKLKNEELWYEFENGGDIHEFHFKL